MRRAYLKVIPCRRLFHYWPEVFWKAPVLPFAFPAEAAGVGGSNSIVGGVRGVAGDMGGCGSVTGRPRGGASRRMIGVTSSGVGGKRRSTSLAHLYLTARPCSGRFDGLPGPAVSGTRLLEIRKHVLGAVGGPERQLLLVPLQSFFRHSVFSLGFSSLISSSHVRRKSHFQFAGLYLSSVAFRFLSADFLPSSLIRSSSSSSFLYSCSMGSLIMRSS